MVDLPWAAAQSVAELDRHLRSAFIRHVNGGWSCSSRTVDDLRILSTDNHAAFYCQQYSLLEERKYLWDEEPAFAGTACPVQTFFFRDEPSSLWSEQSQCEWVSVDQSPDERYHVAPKQKPLSQCVAGSEHLTACFRCSGRGRLDAVDGSGGRVELTCDRCEGAGRLLHSCRQYTRWLSRTSHFSCDTATIAPGADVQQRLLPHRLLAAHLCHPPTANTANRSNNGQLLLDIEHRVNWSRSLVACSPSFVDAEWSKVPLSVKERVVEVYHQQHSTAMEPSLRVLIHRVLVSWMPVIQVRYQWRAGKTSEFLAFGWQLDSIYRHDDDSCLVRACNTGKCLLM